MPETKLNSGKRQIVGGTRGHMSLEERRALLYPQAESIINKFGGARNLARTLKECSDNPEDHYNPSTIYRWMYPVEMGGTGGEIPVHALKTILRCARLAGIMLSTKDIYPHVLD